VFHDVCPKNDNGASGGFCAVTVTLSVCLDLLIVAGTCPMSSICARCSAFIDQSAYLPLGDNMAAYTVVMGNTRS